MSPDEIGGTRRWSFIFAQTKKDKKKASSGSSSSCSSDYISGGVEGGQHKKGSNHLLADIL
jgi:hypothetical protein